eukprot:5257753-Pleurochrysis_carterae.AAC.1
MAALTAEATAAPEVGDAAAVRRLVDNPTYGNRQAGRGRARCGLGAGPGDQAAGRPGARPRTVARGHVLRGDSRGALGRGDGPDSPRGHPRWLGAPSGAPGHGARPGGRGTARGIGRLRHGRPGEASM